jgi:hypothetical protein
MKTFEDLEFGPHIWGGVHARIDFGDVHFSVAQANGCRCGPGTYETSWWVGRGQDHIGSHQTPDDITKTMAKLQKMAAE